MSVRTANPHSRRGWRRFPIRWSSRALGRLVVVAVGVAWLGLLSSRLGWAQAATVPAQLQADFLDKLAAYDRNFASRAGDMVRVLLVTKAGNAKSVQSATVMKASLAQLDRIAGLPHQETVSPYESASRLAKRCREERIAVVYVTPGFEDDLEALRLELRGVDVLSMAAVPEYVQAGIVLGIELQSGKPKILLNYEQAKQQNVNFSSDVLRLMKVYQ